MTTHEPLLVEARRALAEHALQTGQDSFSLNDEVWKLVPTKDPKQGPKVVAWKLIGQDWMLYYRQGEDGHRPVKVPVCSLDCQNCMDAVALRPGGVPFIMVSENFPHDDEGAEV